MLKNAIFIIQCKDQKGIVAAVSDFLLEQKGNILEIDQHIDEEMGDFFMRIKWLFDASELKEEQIPISFSEKVGEKFGMNFKLHFDFPKPRLAIFVSKLSHCLFDILARHYSGEFQVEIPLVISNHTDLQPVVKGFGIPFYHLPITAENKDEQEAVQLRLL